MTEFISYNLLKWGLFLVYLLTSFFYWQDFNLRKPQTQKRSFIMIVILIIIHVAYFINEISRLGRLPLATIQEAINSFVLIETLLYFGLEQKIHERSIGTFIFPFLTLLILVTNLLSVNVEHINPVLFNVGFELHVLAMLIGYSGFTQAFMASLLYLLLLRQLQKHKSGLFFRRMPSLRFFARINNYGTNAGIGFAFIGIGFGVLFGYRVWNTSVVFDPRGMTMLFIWLVYLSHFILRKMGKLTPTTAAYLSLFAYSLLILSSVLIATVVSSLHHFTG